MKTSHGRSQMMRWQNGPINSPMGSPRGLASLSPRSAHVHEGYYQMAHQQHQQPGSAHFWDSFVAKQNAKALDTLSRSGHLSPRSMTPAYLSPRNRGGSISPRLMPGKTLTESLGLELPPLSPRDHGALSPRATRRAFQMHTLEEASRGGAYRGSIDAATERRMKAAARRKAQLTSVTKPRQPAEHRTRQPGVHRTPCSRAEGDARDTGLIAVSVCTSHLARAGGALIYLGHLFGRAFRKRTNAWSTVSISHCVVQKLLLLFGYYSHVIMITVERVAVQLYRDICVYT